MRKTISLILTILMCLLIMPQIILPGCATDGGESLAKNAPDAYIGGNESTPTTSFGAQFDYAESDFDLVANVVAHEVGGIHTDNTYVVITYADGTTLTYNGGKILRYIHARVLENQVNSSMFPNNYADCISMYWAGYLADANFYSHSNALWQSCREDVANNPLTIPSNVYAATCDPCFASYYPGYRLWASVYWNTGWYSGTFYYYQYG